MSITIVLIAITCIVSFVAFSNQQLTDKLIFHPPTIANNLQEAYRFFTCGFIHADIPHLAFNMISLYMFGEMVEHAFTEIFGNMGYILYVLLYLAALPASLIPTYQREKNNYYYRSLGASGAVSAIVFAGILLYPTIKMGIFILPPIIPGFVFGPIYLAITVYLSKQNADNINHSAHFWGAIFGILYLFVTATIIADFNPFRHFIKAIVTAYF